MRTQGYSHSNKVQVRFNAFTMLHHLLQMIGVEKVIVFLAILFSCFRLEKKWKSCIRYVLHVQGKAIFDIHNKIYIYLKISHTIRQNLINWDLSLCYCFQKSTAKFSANHNQERRILTCWQVPALFNVGCVCLFRFIWWFLEIGWNPNDYNLLLLRFKV